MLKDHDSSAFTPRYGAAPGSRKGSNLGGKAAIDLHATQAQLFLFLQRVAMNELCFRNGARVSASTRNVRIGPRAGSAGEA
jgi:hypothetical protein